jgi:hypothetical protein
MVKLYRNEYALTMVMLANKYIFGNWIKCYMCEDYSPMNNKHIWTNVIPLQ